jgi:hypothetical protein
VPQQVSDLGALTDLDARWNALYTSDLTVQAFLDAKQPGWSDTQTVPPTDLATPSVGDHTVWLEWSLIPYTADSGGYRLFHQQLPSGSFVMAGCTQSKAETRFPITGLQPGTSYDLAIDTITYPHEYNPSTVISDPSSTIVATTSSAGCPIPEVVTDSLYSPALLTVATTHDAYEWSTGETSAAITVSPIVDTWYWVATTGPGSCNEAATILIRARLFADGFESGDMSGWSTTVP